MAEDCGSVIELKAVSTLYTVCVLGMIYDNNTVNGITVQANTAVITLNFHIHLHWWCNMWAVSEWHSVVCVWTLSSWNIPVCNVFVFGLDNLAFVILLPLVKVKKLLSYTAYLIQRQSFFLYLIYWENVLILIR